MHVIEGEDVNELYWRGMRLMGAEGRRETSRNGPVRVMSMPVTSVYRKPTQRVLFDQKRGANPFFHLFESLWMLSGRDDVSALNRYITDFGTRFAEEDGRVHGAYGHRWRQALGFDQLEHIVQRLRFRDDDRQCVLQMWDAREQGCRVGECDIQYGANDLNGVWKDRPCNTHVYFRVRKEVFADEPLPFLDMFISCRSNDIVLGAYGANAVHFSILQEYMAGRVGVLVGKMYQMSWNYHAYEETLEKVGTEPTLSTYEGLKIRALPMAKEWDFFDADLKKFMEWQKNLVTEGVETTVHDYKNSWFRNTAEPIFIAHNRWKSAMRHSARDMAFMIEAEDWRQAVIQWFEHRTNPRSR